MGLIYIDLMEYMVSFVTRCNFGSLRWIENFYFDFSGLGYVSLAIYRVDLTTCHVVLGSNYDVYLHVS